MFIGRLFPEAAHWLVRKPATVAYPLERLPVPAGLRGAPRVHEDACIGCRLCARRCPAGAIEMVETAGKDPRPAFHDDICIFCGVCAEVCPRKAIEMTRDYELATPRKEDLTRLPDRAGSD